MILLNYDLVYSKWASVYLPAILVIIFLNFTKFQYGLHSPQVKRNFIFSIANLVYELPNDERLLGSQEIRKYQKNLKPGWRQGLVPSLSSRTFRTLLISCPILLDFCILFEIYCPGLQLLIDVNRFSFSTKASRVNWYMH